MHFSMLLTLASMALALPSPSIAPSMQLYVSRFQARASPSSNSTSFYVADSTESNIHYCTGSLGNPNTWQKCTCRKGSGEEMAFQFGEEMSRLGLRKGWMDGAGMPITGFADGQTNWCDEKGGNVTVKGKERFYQRRKEWILTMDKLSA
ncbi:hypothetical protein HBI39_099740 [Parastagonospora nodorum]|nr:hypothetical protein HBI39_099740 [Parastagonospora nodorum]